MTSEFEVRETDAGCERGKAIVNQQSGKMSNKTFWFQQVIVKQTSPEGMR